MASLDQKIEKFSPTLNRQAMYTQKSRLSRIPTNLTVHMVRFAWKREIGKKAKIMRRVAFPQELDVLDLCTEELRKKLQPVNKRLQELERDRSERRKVRKRTKKTVGSTSDADVEMADIVSSSSGPAGPPSPVLLQAPVPAGAEPPTVDAVTNSQSQTQNDKGKGKEIAGGELAPEKEYRERELAELQALIPEDLRSDTGASVTGLYELVGIVAHKGAEEDSGHYIGYVKKRALHPVKVGDEGEKGALDEDDEDWYKFDDEKVSIFPKDKLPTLEGGGKPFCLHR